MRWVPILPSSIGNRDKASSHVGREAQCGLMMVKQWKRCHEKDETASVRRVRCSVRCRVVKWGKFETSSGSDRDRDSSHDAEAMEETSASV